MQSGGPAVAILFILCLPAIAVEHSPDHPHGSDYAHATEAQKSPDHPKVPDHAKAPDRPRASDHVCLTAAQAREIVAQRRLVEPFRIMQTTARHFQAEALRAKLCRRKDELIYEISLLRRDGRVIHVSINAVSGKIVRTVNAK